MTWMKKRIREKKKTFSSACVCACVGVLIQHSESIHTGLKGGRDLCVSPWGFARAAHHRWVSSTPELGPGSCLRLPCFFFFFFVFCCCCPFTDVERCRARDLVAVCELLYQYTEDRPLLFCQRDGLVIDKEMTEKRHLGVSLLSLLTLCVRAVVLFWMR